MATSAGEVEVKLTLNAEDFKRVMGESQQGVNHFNSALETIGGTLVAVFSFAKIAEFFKNSLTAYSESQLGIAKLTAALGSHGLASEQMVTHLENQARALEKLTGAEQVEITRVQSLLATFGLAGPVLDKATQATVNLSIGMGINLEHAAILMAKAFEGNTTMLARYGLKIDQTIEPAKRFESLLGLINQRFGPVASAQVGTFAGQLTATSNAFVHLEEAVGKLLSGPSGGILGWLKTIITDTTTIVEWLNRISESTHSFAAVLGGMIIGAMQTLLQHMVNVLSIMLDIASHIPLIGKAFVTLKSQVDLMKLAVAALGQVERQNYLDAVANHKIELANLKEKDVAFRNTAQSHMDVTAAMNKWIVNQNMLSRDEFLNHLKEEDLGFFAFKEALKVYQKDLWQFGTKMSDAFFTGVGDNFARMVVEGKNFSESMKALFRSMAVSIIGYIIQIILKMLALYALEEVVTFGGSSAGAGAASAAAAAASSGFQGYAAQGGMINEPSVITGLRTGSKIIAGEAGPEAIVPMNSVNGGGSGQGNITINISGQFIDGDSTAWQKLMREKIIPQIRRFTMSSPTGPFNRTRGVV